MRDRLNKQRKLIRTVKQVNFSAAIRFDGAFFKMLEIKGEIRIDSQNYYRCCPIFIYVCKYIRDYFNSLIKIEYSKKIYYYRRKQK